jgi:hypothetical protein
MRVNFGDWLKDGSIFDRFRRTRHQRLYQGKEAAMQSQAEKAIDTARHLLKLVRKMVT